MESKGMALRSRRAPQLSEIFRYQAQPQDIEDDLEKMSRLLTRLKRRRMQRTNASDAVHDARSLPRDLEKTEVYHERDRGPFLTTPSKDFLTPNKRPSHMMEEKMDETESRPINPEFRPWSKFDPVHYHHTFQ